MQDLLADLNEPQRQAVMHVDGPLLVLAGAGSGKTRVITRRVAYMVQQGVAPWNVLAITFTNKAAGEMRERVEQLGVPRGALLCTFHSLCARLLREFALEAGLATNFSIYDRDDQLKIAKQAVAAEDLLTDNFPPAKVLSAISSAKNDLKSPSAMLAQAGAYYDRNLAGIYKQYEQLLAANNAMDFDDLLLRMAQLIAHRPDVRSALGNRYRYILIDEYQDTNRAQYVLAHSMALEHENICATGDPDQSIYAWRGADVNNILEFERDYPNAVVVRLEENYRSTAPILGAASRLIAHNRKRKDKKLWTRREGGNEVRVVFCDDERSEATLIAQQIAEYQKAGGAYSDVAIFYRVNSLSRVVEDALFRAGLPYRIARGVEFYNRKEIKDVLAYLKLLANPKDDLSCLRAINTPPRGIGQATVDKLVALGRAQGIGLLGACRHGDQAGLAAGAANKAMAFAKLIDKIAGSLDMPVKTIVEQAIRESGIEKALAGADEDARQARANVEELVSSAAEFDAANEGAKLADYLQLISLVSDVDHYDGSTSAVTLMTLHAAKGLEFPAVFIVGCEAGLLPFQRADEDSGSGRFSSSDRYEEERRLAFVGMTRAMRQLTLTCARQRMFRGRTNSQAASPFLGEIGKEGVVFQNATTPQGGKGGNYGQGGYYADTHERAAIEAGADANEPDPARIDQAEAQVVPFPPEYEYLRVGSIVRHKMYGRGKVVHIHQPWPQTRAKIIFDDLGEKTIVLCMTTLDIL